MTKRSNKPQPTCSVLSLTDLREKFLQVYSDPTDSRSIEKLARQWSIQTKQLLAWKSDPAFVQEAAVRYRRLLPGLLIDIQKALTVRAAEGGVTASRLLLEIHGILKGKGDVNVQVNTGSPESSAIAKLSDGELDTMIEQLVQCTSPSDVLLQNGEVVSIPEAEVIDLETSTATPANSPMRGMGREGPEE